MAVALPLPAHPRARRAAAAGGIVAGARFVAGSYPWLLPTWFDLVVAGTVGCWGVLVAVPLVRARTRTTDATLGR